MRSIGAIGSCEPPPEHQRPGQIVQPRSVLETLEVNDTAKAVLVEEQIRPLEVTVGQLPRAVFQTGVGMQRFEDAHGPMEIGRAGGATLLGQGMQERHRVRKLHRKLLRSAPGIIALVRLDRASCEDVMKTGQHDLAAAQHAVACAFERLSGHSTAK